MLDTQMAATAQAVVLFLHLIDPGQDREKRIDRILLFEALTTDGEVFQRVKETYLHKPPQFEVWERAFYKGSKLHALVVAILEQWPTCMVVPT